MSVFSESQVGVGVWLFLKMGVTKTLSSCAHVHPDLHLAHTVSAGAMLVQGRKEGRD
jgi:hypothetical protein